MSTSEPDSAPTPLTKPRQRRSTAAGEAAPTSPELRPVERLDDAPAAGATAVGASASVLGSASDPPPAIDEDGSWIEADAVEVHQGAIGRVDATEVSVTQGAIGAARAERISVEMGAVGAALGGNVSVSRGFTSMVLAQEARLDQAIVRTLIARDVTFARPSVVLFALAQKVTGEVRVLLDWRGALAFGAAFGIVAGIFGRGRGGRRGRG